MKNHSGINVGKYYWFLGTAIETLGPRNVLIPVPFYYWTNNHEPFRWKFFGIGIGFLKYSTFIGVEWK